MLDLGFLPDVEKLIGKTPPFRQTMLFSATMRGEVIALARTHMRHPVNIRAESSADGQRVPQYHGTVRLPGTRPGQAGVHRPHPAGREPRAHAHLHAHQTAGPAGRRGHDGPRLPGRATARRHGAGGPGEGAQALPRRHRADPGRDGRGGARDRRRGRHPRDQLHLPRRREELRPPHRPDRTRRRVGDRHHVRRLGRPDPLEDHQQGPRAAVRRARRDLLDESPPLPRPRHPVGGQGSGRSPPRSRRGSSSRIARPGTARATRGGLRRSAVGSVVAPNWSPTLQRPRRRSPSGRPRRSSR